MNKLPDCMMPDGAEPCAGYKEALERIEELEKAIKAHRVACDYLVNIPCDYDEDLWRVLND